jgi:hypothetical protein
MLIAGVVLQIGVGHKGRNTVKNCGGEQHPPFEVI